MMFPTYGPPPLPHAFYGQATDADGVPVDGFVCAMGKGTKPLDEKRGDNPIAVVNGRWGARLFYLPKLVVQTAPGGAPVEDGTRLYFYVNGELAQIETPEGLAWWLPYESGELTEIRLRI